MGDFDTQALVVLLLLLLCGGLIVAGVALLLGVGAALITAGAGVGLLAWTFS